MVHALRTTHSAIIECEFSSSFQYNTTMATTTLSRPPALAHYRDNIYFQDGALLTGILATLLYLTVAISLDAAGHVASMTLLIPVTLGAVGLGMLMSYSRFDGFFALSHSMFTGLAWILYLMAGLVSEKEIESFLDFGIPELQAKVYFVLWKLLNWVDAAISNSASNDNYVFIFEISFLVWWLTYLGVWAIFRYGYTWRAIMPAGIVLLINTYYAPQSVVGFLVVFCLLALIFLIRTNLAEQQLRWREGHVYFNQDIAFDFLRNGFMYSIIVLAIAWLLPGLGRSGLVRAIMDPVNDVYQDINERVSESYPGLNRPPGSNTPTFGDTLTLKGERKVENKPVFSVDTPVGRYWRAVAFDTFDGRQWRNTLEAESEFAADTLLPVPSWELRTPITQTITLLSGMGNVIVGPPDIRQVSVPIEARGQASPAAALTATFTDPNQPPLEGYEIVMAHAQDDLEPGNSYTVVSQYTQVTQQALRTAGTGYPQVIVDRYLQLPENFSLLVAQTAISVTTGTVTPFEQAKAIEAFLRTYTYNDAIPEPPADRDPVEYFLFDIREGYCDYYATAMVLMLRSLNVPARAVSGYAEGFFDEEQGSFYVTDADAHTWVEVFFPNYGWVEFEPTAGESPLDRPEGIDPNAPDSMDGAVTPSASTPITSSNSPVDPMQDPLIEPQGSALGEGTGGGRWWVWALLTPILLVAGIWGLRRSQAFGPTTFTPELPPLLYERLQRWAERLGLHTRASETPYEQARTFSRALPDGQPFISEITDTYVRYRFGPQPAEGEMPVNGATTVPGQRLIEAWQQLQPMLWRAWGRKLAKVNGRRNPFDLKSR
jgi:transglutaminase-like putative cysteine protease